MSSGSNGLEGVMISFSVGIGRNMSEAEAALKYAKHRKALGLRYNIATYDGEPLHSQDTHVPSGTATADSYLRLESRLSALDDRQGLEDLEVLKYDPATGLLNRVGYEIEVLRMKNQGRYTGRAIIMLDGDSMKQVNEHLGYEVTDSYLAAVGKALLSQIRTKNGDRDKDVLLNRKNGSGGDEFVIDIGCAKDDAWLAAMRYIDAVYDAQLELSQAKAEQEIDRMDGSIWVDLSDL